MSAPGGPWEELERAAPECVTVDGVEIRACSRVRLRPRPRGDVLDVALAGRAATVDEILDSVEGGLQVAVTVQDDPGADLGAHRRPGHRFFFAPDELEPLEGAQPAAAGTPRILIAGIGNVFLGDDGFGVAVAGRLADREQPPGVHVEDFGIRGMDLAYALHDYDAALLVDATPRGQPPGTLSVIEPDLQRLPGGFDAHGMDPVKVLGLARALGEPLPRVLVVGCEPETLMTGEEDEVVYELSAPVQGAIDEAVELVESWVERLQAQAGREAGS